MDLIENIWTSWLDETIYPSCIKQNFIWLILIVDHARLCTSILTWYEPNFTLLVLWSVWDEHNKTEFYYMRSFGAGNVTSHLHLFAVEWGLQWLVVGSCYHPLHCFYPISPFLPFPFTCLAFILFLTAASVFGYLKMLNWPAKIYVLLEPLMHMH